MAKRRNFLSDSDVTTLRRLIADVGTLRAQIRTLHERDGKQKRGGAHYLMKAPSGGVPAASGTPSEPGSADCLIQYREGDPKTIHDTTRPEVVYNATGTPISGNALFLAHRDSWGDLWAESVANCPDIGLAPGSYRSTAGATIAPGETGPIQVSGGDDCATFIINAVNHSECTFYLGERITAHVDKCCTAWFTGCSCCGSEPSPPDCCERSVAICIAGELKLVPVDGGSASWDISACCDCVGATLEIAITCTPGSGNGPGEGPGPGGNTTITATWTYTCGESVVSDTVDLSSLCNDEADVEILGEIAGVCEDRLNARFANFVEACEPCDTYTSICESCTSVTSITDGGVFIPSDQPFEKLNITSSAFSFSRTTLVPGSIYRIDVELSKLGNNDSDSFRFSLVLPGSVILSWSPTTDPVPVITQRVLCGQSSTIQWDFTFNENTVRNFWVIAGFDGCTVGASPTQGFLFRGQNFTLGTTQEVVKWEITCAEC